jgi:hypothetical protein
MRARAQMRVQGEIPQTQSTAIIYLRLDGEIEEQLRALDVPLVILQTEPGLMGIGSESVRWEVGVGVAAHLLSDPTYAGAPQLPAWSRLSKMVERFQRKGSFSYSIPNWDTAHASVWWSQRTQGHDVPGDLQELGALVLDRLEPGRSLFVGIYQARSRAMIGALSDAREALENTFEVSIVYEFGRPPEAKSIGGFSLLIGHDPKVDMEVPGLGLSYGDLQAASMIADYEQEKEAGGEACAVLVKEDGGAIAMLQAMIDQAGSAVVPSVEQNNSQTKGEG